MKPSDRVRIKLPAAVSKLYEAVEELKSSYPGRPFALDGHLVGSIGEVVARETFGFELLPPSFPGHDAKCSQRGYVQIKITAGDKIAFRGPCDHLIVLKIVSPNEAEVLYDGKGDVVWNMAGKLQRNGQRQLSVWRLDTIREQLSQS